MTAAEETAISKWITFSFPSTLNSRYRDPVLRELGGGYDYINPRDGYTVDRKTLFFRFNIFRLAIPEGYSKEEAEKILSGFFPITVTFNEEKLAEIKAKTNITGNLVAGTKTATLDRLYKGEGQKETNLLEKYDLSIDSYIWNDYMPGGPRPFSNCAIAFDSATKLPPMEVSATIITERITMPDIELYDIYKGNGTYGKLFRKDFRPVNGFRLNDGEEYTIKITVKISGEQQTITLENQKVDVTW
jgi:hypothetical protein